MNENENEHATDACLLTVVLQGWSGSCICLLGSRDSAMRTISPSQVSECDTTTMSSQAQTSVSMWRECNRLRRTRTRWLRDLFPSFRPRSKCRGRHADSTDLGLLSQNLYPNEQAAFTQLGNISHINHHRVNPSLLSDESS